MHKAGASASARIENLGRWHGWSLLLLFTVEQGRGRACCLLVLRGVQGPTEVPRSQPCVFSPGR